MPGSAILLAEFSHALEKIFARDLKTR